ncbi:ElyC/SanA/YdcF family protein [Actinoplanes sp. NPDC026619]|uniref:SanA/YdcF family protein n=1 Tax=Actinoplanes sp. NPDC026619 TaxID=3155798 RepID=UPI0033FE1A65
MLTRNGIVEQVPLPYLVFRFCRRLITVGAFGGLLAVLVLVSSSLWVRGGAAGQVYAEASVPEAPVALVLGAQVYADNEPSPFLAARLDIAKRLLDAGKVKAILVSGDHRRWEYDEPGSMQVYLVARGVPASKVVLDYAGFDTYDSCARAHRIFGVDKAIVVTQSYHIERAVTLCRHLGVDATGVGDDTVRIYTAPWRNSVIRERGAVVKAAYDALSHRDPVFLGRQETGIEQALS